MVQVLINFFTFNALSSPPEVYFAMAVTWLLLVTAGVASVVGRKCSVLLKLFWIMAIIAVPVVGMFLYCVYCLIAADYSFLKMFGLHRQSSFLRNPRPRRG